MSKRKDYIPRTDADFDLWQENLLNQLKSDKPRFALSDESETSLTALQTEWQRTNEAHVQAQAAARAASVAKDDAREAFETALRQQVRQTQSAPGVTDSDRAQLGVTIRDTEPTAPAAPATRPVAQVDTGQRLRHTLMVTDEMTPTSRAKPKGVSHYEVWVKVGDAPPVDASQLRFLDTSTTASFDVDYEGADGGKIAHYMLRWVNSRKQKGPWSHTVSATITA